MPDPIVPATAPSPNQIDEFITDIQRDGRLLLRYLSGRPDRSSTPAAEDAAAGTTAAILFESLTHFRDAPAEIQKLLGYLDYLSRQTSPATLPSIRSSYIHLGFHGTDGRTAGSFLSRLNPLAMPALTRSIRLVQLIGIGTVLASIVLLMHVDDGRRTVLQLNGVREERATVYNDLAKLETSSDWVLRRPTKLGDAKPGDTTTIGTGATQGLPALGFVPYCSPPTPAPSLVAVAASRARPEPTAWREQLTPQANSLCARLGELQLREAIVFLRLAEWNARMARMVDGIAMVFSFVSAPTCATEHPPSPTADCAPGAGAEGWPIPVQPLDWKRTELRTNASISLISGYVLPLLLGGVGGCVAGLRRVQQKTTLRTLNDSDGSYSLLQALLGMTLGGLLGAIFSSDGPVQIGEYHLSLAGVAFFVGFSLEVVFKTMEALVGSVSQKLHPADAPLAADGAADRVG